MACSGARSAPRRPDAQKLIGKRRLIERIMSNTMFLGAQSLPTKLIHEKQILKELERVKPELDAISLRPANVMLWPFVHPDAPENGGAPVRRLPDRDHWLARVRPLYPRQPVPSSSVPSSAPSATTIDRDHILPTPVRTAKVSKPLP
ncbi:hypothetical protein PCASD_25981 [Puccinia coronata f. sp. avenae]|uniref:Uncharacterized protein n=1 Tax=Puccinia coronata f. sp. avenae TaxID=200324 RepID=A0A2N5S1P2_9BASI|nr:hypothetical protein PCASD_25981 [Puccinia coronata f. sp. avenae]